jgi:hypothetical protein
VRKPPILPAPRRRLRLKPKGLPQITPATSFAKRLLPPPYFDRQRHSFFQAKGLTQASPGQSEERAPPGVPRHVVDIADPHLEQKFEAVEAILTDLELGEIPRLVVFNKADLLPEPEVQALCRRFDAIAVSAVKRQGLTDLIHAAEEKLNVEEPMTKGPALPGAKVAEEVAAAMDVEVGPFGVN